MAKQNKDNDAGKAFERAADIQTQKLNEPDDAANSLIDAFKSYRSGGDFASAARGANIAIDRYCAKGNFRRAASQKEQLGEMLEQNGDAKGALEAFQDAASWYEGDGANA